MTTSWIWNVAKRNEKLVDFSIEIEWAIQVTSWTAIIIFIISIAVGFPVASLMDEFTHLSSCRDFTLMMMMMMMMIVMKTAIINNINKSFLLQLPSDESWNASGTRLSQTWAFLDVRFSTMSSNFTIHFELSLALKLPSWSILETSYSLVQLLSL